ncbi:hypothetical protein C8R43DRAFT_1103379 [Mycena crocata]|nr:hypothetical protein C8R43DRAFT_1103379 [Mycena crocata]
MSRATSHAAVAQCHMARASAGAANVHLAPLDDPTNAVLVIEPDLNGEPHLLHTLREREFAPRTVCAAVAAAMNRRPASNGLMGD